MSLLTLAFLVAPAIVLPSPGAVRLRCAASGSACRLAPQVQMQEGDQGGGERQRGRTAVVQRPKAEPKEMSKEDVSNEPMWRLLIHNDDVHTWDYVIFAIVSVVQNVSRKKAHRITTTVHTMGSATVTITWKQQVSSDGLGRVWLGRARVCR